MSLVRIAARIAAVQALKGRTSVGDNVLDSEIGALDIDAAGVLQTDEPKPFISVYTDEARSENNSLRAWVSNGRTEFLFEAGIAAAHVEPDPENGSGVIYEGVPDTDANFEFHLDMVARQIGDALTDPDNEWAEIFRKFVTTYLQVDRSRTSSGAKDGTRLAAHQIKLVAEIIADPVRGEPLNPRGPMARFFAKAKTVPELQSQIAMMREQLAGTIVDWKQSSRRFGQTFSEADSMLLTPLWEGEPASP